MNRQSANYGHDEPHAICRFLTYTVCGIISLAVLGFSIGYVVLNMGDSYEGICYDGL